MLVPKGNNLIATQLVTVSRVAVLFENKASLSIWIHLFVSLKLWKVCTFKDVNIHKYIKIASAFLFPIQIKFRLKVPPNCRPVIKRYRVSLALILAAVRLMPRLADKQTIQTIDLRFG